MGRVVILKEHINKAINSRDVAYAQIMMDSLREFHEMEEEYELAELAELVWDKVKVHVPMHQWVDVARAIDEAFEKVAG